MNEVLREAEKVGVLRIGRRRIEVVDRRWLAHRARGTVAGSVRPLWQTSRCSREDTDRVPGPVSRQPRHHRTVPQG